MEYCKGCYTRNECLYTEGAKTIKCPCEICLVKAVCVTICNDYEDFADKVFYTIIIKKRGK